MHSLLDTSGQQGKYFVSLLCSQHCNSNQLCNFRCKRLNLNLAYCQTCQEDKAFAYQMYSQQGSNDQWRRDQCSFLMSCQVDCHIDQGRTEIALQNCCQRCNSSQHCMVRCSLGLSWQ